MNCTAGPRPRRFLCAAPWGRTELHSVIAHVTSSLYKRRAGGLGKGLAGVTMASEKSTEKKKNGHGGHNGKNGHAILSDKDKYRPSDKELFMNERQREYFRKKLLDWRDDILKEAKETLQHLQDE